MNRTLSQVNIYEWEGTGKSLLSPPMVFQPPLMPEKNPKLHSVNQWVARPSRSKQRSVYMVLPRELWAPLSVLEAGVGLVDLRTSGMARVVLPILLLLGLSLLHQGYSRPPRTRKAVPGLQRGKPKNSLLTFGVRRREGVMRVINSIISNSAGALLLLLLGAKLRMGEAPVVIVVVVVVLFLQVMVVNEQEVTPRLSCEVSRN